jgi:coenzyme F420-reducing hydrogenase alpha subunit
MTDRTIKVDYISRVEGEGALHVTVKDNTVKDVQLRIFEPPRFYEAFLRGRSYTEAPDITARICGICPVAYQTSSVNAMEMALKIKATPEIKALRRLLYMGEYIESHALHIYMLQAPDFLGYPDAIRMAADHPDAVVKALELKKIGNDLMTLIGGREIHPVNVRVGGFYRAPTKEEFAPIRKRLERALALSEETARFTASLKYPDFEEDYEFVAVRHPELYGVEDGDVVSNKGVNIKPAQYEEVFEEVHVPYAHALQSVKKPKRTSYFVGPLARYALNHDRLTPKAAKIAKEIGLGPVVNNPYKGMMVRAVELVMACEEAIRIIDSYKQPVPSYVEPPAKLVGGVGMGVSEAPRGVLYHRYRVGDDGLIKEAKITPPTAQNQMRMEEDLRHLVSTSLSKSDEDLTLLCEQNVRNYDPCISCATHFLKLDIKRE